MNAIELGSKNPLIKGIQVLKNAGPASSKEGFCVFRIIENWFVGINKKKKTPVFWELGRHRFIKPVWPEKLQLVWKGPQV